MSRNMAWGTHLDQKEKYFKYLVTLNDHSLTNKIQTFHKREQPTENLLFQTSV